jgi:hypothetical protein
VDIGSIFAPGPFGTWVIAAGEELIGEEAAIEAARAGLQALDMEISSISDEAVCELDAAQDALIYVVTIDFIDEDGRTRNYLATINAHTGELRVESISR